MFGSRREGVLVLLLALVTVSACLMIPVYAQPVDAQPNAATAPDGFIPFSVLYWLAGILAPAIGAMWAVCLALVKRVWDRLEKVQGEIEEERGTWQEEKEGLIEAWQEAKDDLIAAHEEEKDKTRSSLREEKTVLREAFETEKKQMRELYTGEITALRERLETEQKERRAESAGLFREINQTTREVMEVVQIITKSLDQSTSVIDKFNEEARK